MSRLVCLSCGKIQRFDEQTFTLVCDCGKWLILGGNPTKIVLVLSQKRKVGRPINHQKTCYAPTEWLYSPQSRPRYFTQKYPKKEL